MGSATMPAGIPWGSGLGYVATGFKSAGQPSLESGMETPSHERESTGYSSSDISTARGANDNGVTLRPQYIHHGPEASPSSSSSVEGTPQVKSIHESGTDALQDMTLYDCYSLLGKLIGGAGSNWELERQVLQQKLQTAAMELNKERTQSQSHKDRLAVLENMNSELESKNRESMTRSTQLESRNQELEFIHSHNRKDVYTSMEKKLAQRLQDSQSEIETLQEKARGLSSKVASLERERSHLKWELQSNSEKISYMTNDLLRLSNLNPEPTRDDQSLGAGFSTIFLAVQEWILRYFDKDIITHGQRAPQYTISSKDMDETLRSVLSDWPESRYFQKAPLLFLQAVVAQYVVEYILGPFLLGQFKDEERLFGQGDDNDANSSDGERDIRDLQRWRNLTATISSRSEKFQKTVSDELDVHAIQLQNIICGITGNGDDTKRTRALRSKVLQPASELAILCHQQPDRFLYNFGELPGTKRKTSKYKLQDIIVDVNGQRRENELRKSEVAFYVSPLIRRVTLVGGGDAAIVAKARVYLIKQSWLY